MKKVGLSLLVFCIMTNTATGGTVKLIGAGASASCGQWLSDRQNKDFDSMSEWALGFLSGVAVETQDYNPLNGVDSEAVLYWLDNHCRAHPITRFADALDAFVIEHPR